MKPQIIIAENHQEFIRQGAEVILEIGQNALAKRGRFLMVLSGGSTPKPIYQKLASPEYASALDWSKGHIFWSDERAVPPDHPDSNYRMAKETLLDALNIPIANIHRVEAESDPDQAVAAYENELQAFFPDQTNSFDLVLLGVGDDGHTASLFPGTTALEETEKWVAANFVEKLDSWRITLTYPAINSAANVLFLVSGESKAAALNSVLQLDDPGKQFPARLVRPAGGNLIWMLDPAAAGMLSLGE